MILSAETARLIRSGRKTQLRLEDCPFKPGKCYAVQTHAGRKATLHITVTDVREELLEQITLRDAKREGHRTTGEFRKAWEAEHGPYRPGLLVHVVSFEVGDVTDKPRLLKARPGGEQYTSVPSLALPGSAEEVSEDELKRYAARADESRKTGLGEQRERLLAAVASIRLETARQNIGTSPARKRLKSIEHHLRAMEQEARRSA